MRRRRVHPYPEIIMPGAWTIRHQARGGHTVPKDRILSAPLVDSPFARGLRLHELAHVRWSPPRIRTARLRQDTVLAVEDARVNELVCRAGLGHVLAALDDPAAGHVDPRDDLRVATLLLVAAHGTRAFDRLWETYAACGDAGRQAQRLAEDAVGSFRDRPMAPPFRATLDAAVALDRALGSTGGAIVPFLCCEAAGRARHRRHDDSPLRGRGGGVAHVQWGELQGVEQPPRPLPSRSSAVRHRAADGGAVFRHAHRLLVDGRVFARRVRLPGGTLLIDGSGSMRLEAQAILALLDAAPGAQVAKYDGADEGWGRIRILARGGWRVSDPLLTAKCCGRGNLIDGPALRWLGTQPRPRVWVSDGGVTGVGDVSSADLRREAGDLCDRYGITRVEDADGARAALERRAHGRPSP